MLQVPSEILVVVNAMGLPLLAFAFLILFRAYQRANETNKEVVAELREENKRLSERLATGDATYMELASKMRVMVARSNEAIEELQARKIELLTNAQSSPEETLQAEVEKINESLNRIAQIHELRLRYDLRLRQEGARAREELQILTDMITHLAEQIGDIRARVAIVSVVTSPAIKQRLQQNTSGVERGVVSNPEPSPVSPTEKEGEDKSSERFYLSPGTPSYLDGPSALAREHEPLQRDHRERLYMERDSE
jgi:hypothetical protein